MSGKKLDKRIIYLICGVIQIDNNVDGFEIKSNHVDENDFHVLYEHTVKKPQDTALNQLFSLNQPVLKIRIDIRKIT